MLELDEATTAAALHELAFEDQSGIDRAVDFTAERAHGRTLLEVEAMLRARLRHGGLDLGERTGRMAEEIVDALETSDSDLDV